ncbi:MAG: hypothetical protein Q9191_001261 [Dirinaria sp. TL-2023a]
MVNFNYLLVTPLAILGASAVSSVIDLIPGNFDSIVLQSGKPALVEFFAPWCGHCKKLAPVYEELAQAFDAAKDSVTIAKVDADAEKDLGRRFGVQGFPTLKWFDGKSDKPEEYNGGRDLESLTDFVKEKTGIKIKTKKVAPSAVEMLTDRTFNEQVGRDKDVLVAFTAPWCGRKSSHALRTGNQLMKTDCKSLAPTWETLAQDFASEPSVLIAKVDAEAENSKATAQSQEVKSYPTIKFFPKGSTTAEPYEGGRTESALVEFINAKAGTQRAPGGTLGPKAGLIESMDTIVKKYIAGENINSILSEAKKASNGLNDKYAQYYVKVFEKLGNSQQYAEKELARLEGLMKKGGLAPQKSDDLTSRANILRSFSSKEDATDEKSEL